MSIFDRADSTGVFDPPRVGTATATGRGGGSVWGTWATTPSKTEKPESPDADPLPSAAGHHLIPMDKVACLNLLRDINDHSERFNEIHLAVMRCIQSEYPPCDLGELLREWHEELEALNDASEVYRRYCTGHFDVA